MNIRTRAGHLLAAGAIIIVVLVVVLLAVLLVDTIVWAISSL